MPREFALPGTRPRYAPDRVCDIQHYKIEIKLNLDRKTIAGRCSITINAFGQPRTWIRLDAIELDIERVSCANQDLDYSHDGLSLRIEFGRALALDESTIIDIEYSATPRRGIYFIGPDADYPDKPYQVWTQGQDEDSRYWFPCFDSPIQKATSEVIATVPQDFYALSNGALVSDTTEGTLRTMHWRLDVPHSCYLITLAAGEFAELRDTWEDIEVSYYVERGREEDCMRTIERTPEMLELFSRLFGVRYPYNKYSQVFVSDFIFGGMENTTATTLTDTALLDERAALDFQIESLVCHELAHQWFGDLLTCRDWGEGWLNEGFATYSEYLWREHAEGRDAAAVELAEFTSAYLSEDRSRYRRSIVTKHYDDPLDIFDRHLYDKAGRVVHMIRRVLGDDDFFAAVRHYLEKHRTGAVETRDLARAIDEATGQCLDWFFDQWLLEGSGHPEFKVRFQWRDELSVLSVEVEQTQETDAKTPVFRVPTQIETVVNGEHCLHDVLLTDKAQILSIPLDSEPEQAIFDPGKHILCELSSQKSPAMWRAQLSGARDAMDRSVAAAEVAKLGSKKAEDALEQSLREDAFWGVRVAAAEGLGHLRTPGARDILKKHLVSDDSPKVRRAAARGLGQFLRDKEAADALIKTIEGGDPSYFVEAQCCLALGQTRSPRAPEVLRSALDRSSFMEVIRQHIFSGLAAARDDSAFDLLLSATEYGRSGFDRRAAINAMATLAAKRQDVWTLRVRERLEELLRDPDFRVQRQAIVALDTLGDPLACASLQALVDDGSDGRLKRLARETLRNLREGSGTNSQLGSLQDHCEQLRKEVLELKGRLGGLEVARTQERQSRTRRESGGGPLRIRRTGGKKTIPRIQK